MPGMSPTDLEEHLFSDPFVPQRLTLASGDQVIVDNPQRALIAGPALYYGTSDDPAARVGKRVKVISIPNIVLIEPVDQRPGRNGRRRRS